jgi:succinylglutamate desuccinylase
MYAIQRIIGKYIGKERGPMLLVFGAMHGNEPAGVEAIKMLFRALALEPYHNPEFSFNGSILGLLGNKAAYTKNVRYINTDLNRSWIKEKVVEVFNKSEENLTLEEQELKDIVATVNQHIKEVNPTEIVMLDIHTTSSNGGIFTIASDEPRSMDIAMSLKAPVVTKVLQGVHGTSMHFFDGENMGLETTALCFEAGQHLDILSPGRAYAAIVNCLKKIGCVKEHHVENKHEKILIEFSKNLPKVATLIYKHHINPGINFQMLPGFVSFDKVSKGQHLANDINGPVFADEDGLILMPLYQEQGDEGYFVVVPEDIEIK